MAELTDQYGGLLVLGMDAELEAKVKWNRRALRKRRRKVKGEIMVPTNGSYGISIPSPTNINSQPPRLKKRTTNRTNQTDGMS